MSSETGRMGGTGRGSAGKGWVGWEAVIGGTGLGWVGRVWAGMVLLRLSRWDGHDRVQAVSQVLKPHAVSKQVIVSCVPCVP